MTGRPDQRHQSAFQPSGGDETVFAIDAAIITQGCDVSREYHSRVREIQASLGECCCTFRGIEGHSQHLM
jgi:hypothetical protein